MGSFSVPCAVSGIAIGVGTPVVLVAVVRETVSNKYAPFRLVAPPIYGTYDDYGLVDVDYTELEAPILEATKLEWWDRVGLSAYTDLIKDPNFTRMGPLLGCKIQTTYYNRQERVKIDLMWLPRSGSAEDSYGGVEIFCVLRSIWDLKDNVPMSFFHNPSMTTQQRLKDLEDFVLEEADAIIEHQTMSPEERHELLFEMFGQFVPHPLFYGYKGGAPDVEGLTSLLWSIQQHGSSYSPGLISNSPWLRMMLNHYQKMTSKISDMTDLCMSISSMIRELVACATFEMYMEMSGVTLDRKPSVAQFAGESWGAQRQFYADVLAVLDGMIAASPSED